MARIIFVTHLINLTEASGHNNPPLQTANLESGPNPGLGEPVNQCATGTSLDYIRLSPSHISGKLYKGK